MYAIVETGGKQYQMEEGRYVDIELLEDAPESKVVFKQVVMLVNGKKSKVGQPYVANASVEGVVVKHDKTKKVLVYKQRAKKGYRKLQVFSEQWVWNTQAHTVQPQPSRCLTMRSKRAELWQVRT